MAKTFTSKDAKNLINKANTRLSDLKKTADLDSALRQDIIKAADSYVTREMMSYLRCISVAELNDVLIGLKPGVLEAHKLNTLEQIYLSSSINLSSLCGFSVDSANTIKKVVNDFAEKVKKSVKINLSSDNKNSYTTTLIKAIYIYKKSISYVLNSKELYTQKAKYINNAIEELKPAAGVLRSIFASKMVKIKAVEAYQNLMDILDGEYGKSVNSVISSINKISHTGDSDAWKDFDAGKAEYYSILEKIYPTHSGNDNALQKALDICKDGKQLADKANAVLALLQADINLSDSLEEKIKDAADAYIDNETSSILNSTSAEEVNRGKKGIRVKTLMDNGYTTMADLYNASTYRLSVIRGISDDGAYTIKMIVNDFVADTRNQVKIRLSADNQNYNSTELVKAVSVYKNSLPYISKCNDLMEEKGQYIRDALAEMNPTTNIIRWFSVSETMQGKASKAYQRLNALLDSEFSTQVDDVDFNLDIISVTNSEDAWADFVSNNIRFYNILEKIIPGIMGTDNLLYGLPEDLANDIQEEIIYPDGLKCTLRGYQELGVKYILHQKRVLLGDEMGLGKTIQAIATMVSLKNTGATHFIVVCPASVVTNWCREIAEHSTLKATLVYGENKYYSLRNWIRMGGVAVTTYETTAYFKYRLDSDFKFSMLVVDEAHYIKNPNAKRTENTKQLCKYTDRLLFMTGTPLENKVDEMINLIQVLQPKIAFGLRGISAPQFRNRIAPVYYRRKREDVLTQLPKLIQSKEWCIMGRAEVDAYEYAIISGNYMAARRLSWNVDNLKYSSKATRLKEIVEQAEAENRKIIVFSYFLETIQKIKQFLGNRCLDPINGSVSPQRRQEIIDKLKDKNSKQSVLLAQIQSGGTGLNIQAASVVVICEPQFKPSIEEQAISRAYRMGQAHDVLVYRLLCVNTIDERMTKLLDKKQKIIDDYADDSLAAEIDNSEFGDILADEVDKIYKKRGINNSTNTTTENDEEDDDVDKFSDTTEEDNSFIQDNNANTLFDDDDDDLDLFSLFDDDDDL